MSIEENNKEEINEILNKRRIVIKEAR